MISQWDKANLDAIGVSKRSFLAEPEQFDELVGDVHPDSKAVMGSPLRRLRQLFRKVLAIATFREAEKLEVQEDDWTTDTAEEHQKLDEAAENKRDAVATYEAFMDALGEPLDTE